MISLSSYSSNVLKKLIVLYMVLFASFEMVFEQEPFPSLGQEIAISGQSSLSTDRAVDILSGDHEHNCPDSEGCEDCHKCHLGHCSVLLGSSITFHRNTAKLTYIDKSELFVSRNYQSVFRPPIYT